MKVLLSGASGFVGSHVLDALCDRQIPVVILLRPTSPLDFITHHLPKVEVRNAGLDDGVALRKALASVTHVIHCAGATRALQACDFDRINHEGTRLLIEAVNSSGHPIERVVHLSSLAAHGPADHHAPARESSPPQPVSAYGVSKLAAEKVIQSECRVPWTILRPPAVFGPRDREFLRVFRSVQRGCAPLLAGGHQELSLAYAPDLARIALDCLTHPHAVAQIFHVAAPEVLTARALTDAIAEVLGRRPWRVSVPSGVVRAAGRLAERWARLTGHASILAHDKYRELLAAGWVCDSTRLREQLGLTCATPLRQALAETRDWYRRHGWLRGPLPSSDTVPAREHAGSTSR